MQQKQLPIVWVDRIFARLQGVYGREFTAQFSMIDQSTGSDIGLANAKQVWAEELGSFADWPDAIAYALKNLPERSPNVIRFRELCRHAPPREVAGLIQHKISDEERERNKSKIKELLKSLNEPYADYKKGDGKDWARTIVRTPLNIDGKPRSQAAVEMAKKVWVSVFRD